MARERFANSPSGPHAATDEAVKKAPVASSNIQTTPSTIEIAESFRNLLDHNHRLEEAKRHLEEELSSARRYGHIVGKSEELRTAPMQADAIAPLDRAVLISGEPGTGKELIARTTHELSRRNRAFCQDNLHIASSSYSRENSIRLRQTGPGSV